LLFTTNSINGNIGKGNGYMSTIYCITNFLRRNIMNLIYNVKDKPKFGQLITFAIQQLLAIMAATLVVPIIVGNGMSPAAALFGAGVGTLVYVLFTLRKSPVFLGSSFAFLGSMAAAFAGGVSISLVIWDLL